MGDYDHDIEMNSDTEELSNGDEAEIDVADEEDEPLLHVDDSVAQLVGHSKDVFCLSVSSSNQWLASGSEDDTACLWNLENMNCSEPYCRIQEHVDSVNAIAFNTTSSLLASADMSGCIICTETYTKVRRCKIEDCGDIEWILWHKTADILFSGTNDGMVWMWLIGKTGVQQSKIYTRGASGACTKGKLLPDSKRLLAVYNDGEVRLWDLKSGETLAGLNLGSACYSLDVHTLRPWAAVGCGNGTTALLNTETCKLVNTLKTEKMDRGDGENNETNSVEVVNFAPDAFPWLAVGTASGQLVIYDVETGAARHECDHDGQAVVSAAWRQTTPSAQPTDNSESVESENKLLRILSICMDGGVRVWNAKSGDPVEVHSCGGSELFDACVVERENGKIYVACSGGIIRVFDC